MLDPCRTFLTLLCAAALAGSAGAQIEPSFKMIRSTGGPTSTFMYAIDVNGDGIPDIVQNGTAPPAAFTVSISNGDGTFRPPVSYSISAGNGVPMPIAAGNFNGDGKIDLVLAVTGSNQLAVFLGNGDGTFQAPKFAKLDFRPGEVVSGFQRIWTADFNHDGKPDVVVVAQTPAPANDPYAVGPQDVYIAEGDGAGGFSATHDVYTAPNGIALDSPAIGDFDSDNNADLTITDITECDHGATCSATLHVLYGDGNFNFEDRSIYTNNHGFVAIAAADLNSDGKSDLAFINTDANQLAAFYGQGTRTFSETFYTLPALNFGNRFEMADFNDDGAMDLVMYVSNDSAGQGPAQQLMFLLGGGTPGKFSIKLVTLPDYYYFYADPVVGDFNGDTKPDVVISQSNGGPGDASYLTAAINSTSHGVWSNCTYPLRAQGIGLCSPIAYGSSQISFNVAANSFGQLRKMELWVDGTKVSEQHHTWGNRAWFGWTSSFSAGKHSGTIFAADIGNTLRRLDFSFVVGYDGCSAPASRGVHVCRPAGGGSVPSPTIVQATAAVPGTFLRMEVWVDGTKRYTESASSQMEAAIEMRPGKHRFDFDAVNTDGEIWKQSLTATVQ